MNQVKKYGIRVFVSILIHVFYEVNNTETIRVAFDYGRVKFTSLLYMVVVVLMIWEVLDLAFKHYDRKRYDYGSAKDIVKIVASLTLLTLPLVFFASYLHNHWMLPMIDCLPGNLDMYKATLQGQIFGWLIITARLLRVNFEQIQRMERDKAQMQKNLLISQYENLKSQINPHFLFNSFSVLQSLIETDQKLAGQFLSRLSKLYRHLLDHRDESMGSLGKELEMLDDYIFLLQIRHGESIEILIDMEDYQRHTFIPCMSLQMLIENAVKHNKFSREEPLKVKVFIDGDYLVVTNKVSRKGEIEISTKVGLENIKTRYKFQTDHPVIIEETLDAFTVKMPVLASVKFA